MTQKHAFSHPQLDVLACIAMRTIARMLWFTTTRIWCVVNQSHRNALFTLSVRFSVSSRGSEMYQSCKSSVLRERAECVLRQQRSPWIGLTALYLHVSRQQLVRQKESGLSGGVCKGGILGKTKRLRGVFNLGDCKIDPSYLPFRFAPSRLDFHRDPCCARTAAQK